MNEIQIPSVLLERDRLLELILIHPQIADVLKTVYDPQDAEGYHPQIIRLYGDYGVGKDVWAKFLKTWIPNSEIYRFSEKLREQFKEVGISEAEIDQHKRDPNYRFLQGSVIDGIDVGGLNFREALIEVAEESKRIHGVGFYADPVIGKIAEDFRDGVDAFIVTDTRFPAEEERLQTLANNLGIDLVSYRIPEDLPRIEVTRVA